MKKEALNQDLYLKFYGNFDYGNQMAKEIIPIDTAIVLHLRYRYDKAFKEIGSILGKSISIVYNHHYRGLYLLEKYLNQQEVQTIQ